MSLILKWVLQVKTYMTLDSLDKRLFNFYNINRMKQLKKTFNAHSYKITLDQRMF